MSSHVTCVFQELQLQKEHMHCHKNIYSPNIITLREKILTLLRNNSTGMLCHCFKPHKWTNGHTNTHAHIYTHAHWWGADVELIFGELFEVRDTVLLGYTSDSNYVVLFS